MATTDPNRVSDSARMAIRRAMLELEPHSAEQNVADLISKLKDADDPGEAEDLSKSLVALDRLKKSEDLDPSTRAAVQKADRDLQLQALRRSNPHAAAQIEQRNRERADELARRTAGAA